MRYTYSNTGSLLVSLTQFKAHLHIDGTDEDTELQIYLDAAHDYVERRTQYVLIDKTVTVSHDSLSGYMPFLVETLNSVTAVNSEYESAVIDTDDYYIDPVTGKIIYTGNLSDDFFNVQINFDAVRSAESARFQAFVMVAATYFYNDREETGTKDYEKLNRALATVKRVGWQ